MRRKRPLVTRVSFVLSLILGAVTTLALRDHLSRGSRRARRCPARAGPS